MFRLSAEARACTGVLGIHEMARDIKIDNFSVTFYGANLLQDTKLELSVGNRCVCVNGNNCLNLKLYLLVDTDLLVKTVVESRPCWQSSVTGRCPSRSTSTSTTSPARCPPARRLRWSASWRLTRRGSSWRSWRRSSPPARTTRARSTSCRSTRDWTTSARTQPRPRPLTSSTASSSRPPCSRRSVKTSPEAGGCGWPSPVLSSSSPTCYSWTSRPTTSTWRRACGWRRS